MRLRSLAASAVIFAVWPGQAAAAGFSVGSPSGTVAQLLDATVPMSVSCPQACRVTADVDVSNENARKLALPSWHDDQTIATQVAQNELPAGDSQLGLAVTDDQVSEYLRPSLGFPLFDGLPVTVSARAEWTEPDGTIGTGTASSSATLAWPSVASDHGGRGAARLVHFIRSTTSSALTKRAAVFRVGLAPVTGTRVVRARIRTAGGLLSVDVSSVLSDGHRARRAELRRGGTFIVSLPLRGHGNSPERAEAIGVAPIAAEVDVRVLARPGGRVLDTGRYRFQFVT